MKRKSTYFKYILADATIGKPTVLNKRKNKVPLLSVSSLKLQSRANFPQLHFKRSASLAPTPLAVFSGVITITSKIQGGGVDRD